MRRWKTLLLALGLAALAACGDSAHPTATPAPAGDTVAPVITGASDQTVPAGSSISYRTGVSALDDVDGAVPLEIDAAGVDLDTPGTYTVTYSAVDAAGNRSTCTITVTVTDAAPLETMTPEELEARMFQLAEIVYQEIIAEDQTPYEKAEAIFQYCSTAITYTGDSDKSSWQKGAYDGFTTLTGDCYTYFACCKALLELADIPNVDLVRMGGVTDHYWSLVDVGSGYYHLDCCPHTTDKPITSFLLTQAEAEEYSAWQGEDYYTYDIASCPVTAVQETPMNRAPWHAPGEAE